MTKQIQHQLPTEMRMVKTQRRLVKQSPVRSSHSTYSEGFKRVFALESRLEQDYLNLLQFQEGVSLLQTQPFSILYKLRGRPHRYTPDLQVCADEAFYVDEVKPAETANKIEFKTKARWFGGFLATYGFAYRVITEREIYLGQRADNLRYLRPALSYPEPLTEFERFATTFPSREASVAEVKQHLEDIDIPLSFIRRAVAHRLLHCDLTLPWRDLQFTW